ncbi:MAG: MoaD/ThiS family protein [Crocinitomicaceae bacterium]
MIIKYFGRIAESIGKTQEAWTKTGIDVFSFKKELLIRYPQLRIETIQIAINLELATDSIEINDNDEVAVLPQFAGG